MHMLCERPRFPGGESFLSEQADDQVVILDTVDWSSLVRAIAIETQPVVPQALYSGFMGMQARRDPL